MADIPHPGIRFVATPGAVEQLGLQANEGAYLTLDIPAGPELTPGQSQLRDRELDAVLSALPSQILVHTPGEARQIRRMLGEKSSRWLIPATATPAGLDSDASRGFASSTLTELIEDHRRELTEAEIREISVLGGISLAIMQLVDRTLISNEGLLPPIGSRRVEELTERLPRVATFRDSLTISLTGAVATAIKPGRAA